MAIILKEEEQILNYENQPDIKRNLLQNLFELTKDQYDTLMAAIESIPEDYTQALADIQELQAQVETLTAQIENKADITGNYPNMTVGTSEALISDDAVENDSTPYLFRAVPYDSDRVDEEIVGATVGWNQLAPDIIKALSHTWDEDGNYYYTVTDNCGVDLKVDHVYFAGAKITRTISGNNLIGITIRSAISLILANEAPNGYSYTITKITSNVTDGTLRFNNYSGKRGFNAGDSVSYDDLMVIDLTAWFGSTIADYAYSLESATAGAGVAWIKALLPGGYLAYSASTLKSISGLSAHVMTGKNLINFSDSVVNGGSSPVDIYVQKGTYIVTFDVSNVSVGVSVQFRNEANTESIVATNAAELSGSRRYAVLTTDQDVKKFRFYTAGSVTISNVQLEFGSVATEYEPYKETTYALDSDLTLRGILKMDADHNVYADGDRYLPDGTIERPYAEVDLGTLNWTKVDANIGRFYTSSLTGGAVPSSNAIAANIKCADYDTTSYSNLYNNTPDMAIAMQISPNSGYIYIDDIRYKDSTTTEFKTVMSGKYLVYELATATTETADPYQSPQTCAPGGTEEYVYAEGGSGVPVGHNSKYFIDLVDKLVALPSAAAADGLYLIKQTSGKMSLESYPPEESAGTDDVPASPDVVLERPDDLTIQPIDLTEREDFTPIEEPEPAETDIEMIPDDDEPEPIMPIEEPAEDEEPEEPAEDE